MKKLTLTLTLGLFLVCGTASAQVVEFCIDIPASVASDVALYCAENRGYQTTLFDDEGNPFSNPQGPGAYYKELLVKDLKRCYNKGKEKADSNHGTIKTQADIDTSGIVVQ